MNQTTQLAIQIKRESEEEKKKYDSERKLFIDNFILALKSQDEQIKNLVKLSKVLLENNKQVEKNNSVLKNKIRMSKYIDYQFVKSKQDFQQANERIQQSLSRQAQRYRQELDRGELTKIQLQQEITKLNKQIEQQNQDSLQKVKSQIQDLQEQINDSKQEQKEIISQSEKQKQFLEIQIQGFEKDKSFGRYKWNKRFFELNNGILAIYEKENGSCELKINIKEDGRSIKKKVEQKRKCCIEIRTSDSTLLFSLENMEEQTIWYRSFREARF
ncbi:dual adapter for phosphotyrosine and 3-phosphotyrosine and 3-phosphoinositide [Anaeramoeba flamelloides]|uniref:Dual adapter for phosphotyrosine and 3-phosphotyrosine and 3-phosphoinositide n=1 Tax=Anaeramoeba flamelloides TaxID=1746091 RepID=A0AAV7Y499_9EUKA|nr:dual adapter for phosphotyrosine and 3-phosphotyrosine and 3-phosphoinositide [Anaeramoeba flamelloides]